MIWVPHLATTTTLLLVFLPSHLFLTSFLPHIQEQFSQVLDAMFESTVQAQEHVINQGDDGDNFYVIER